MAMSITFHHCENVRISHTYSQNANSVCLEIHSEDGVMEITMFDLPQEVTDKLKVLHDDDTSDFNDVDAEEHEARINALANAF